MAVVTLPNETDLARYRFRVTLSGIVFGFRFYFNRRADRWFFDVEDAEGAVLRAGIKAVADYALFIGWVQQGRPVGELLAIDPASTLDALLEDLGTRVLVAYDDSAV